MKGFVMPTQAWAWHPALAGHTISAPAGPWTVAPGEAQRNPGIWAATPRASPERGGGNTGPWRKFQGQVADPQTIDRLRLFTS